MYCRYVKTFRLEERGVLSSCESRLFCPRDRRSMERARLSFELVCTGGICTERSEKLMLISDWLNTPIFIDSEVDSDSVEQSAGT